MMLPGRLRRTTLGDLLGTVYRAGVSGVLELVEAQGERAGRAHRIYFDRGLVDDVETSFPAPRLGEVLSKEGLLSRDSLVELTRRLLSAPGERAGQVLVNAELASEAAVVRGLRRQLRLRLDALFRLGEADIRFHVRRPARAARFASPLTPPEFLHGRPRARARGAGPRAESAVLALAASRALGVEPWASRDEVRRAFRKLAAQVHPDRHYQATPAERAELLRRFAELSSAYHLLTR